MPAIRFRAHNFVCSIVLYDIPEIGDVVYVKHKLKPSSSPDSSPVRWLGCICSKGARRLSWSRPCKLVASAVTDKDGVSGTWTELNADQYVVGILIQLDESTYGAFAVVGSDYWPIVRSETIPLLRIVRPAQKAKIVSISR